MKPIGKTTIIPLMEKIEPEDWSVYTPKASFWYVAGEEPCETLPGYPEGVVIDINHNDTSINIVLTQQEVIQMLNEIAFGRERVRLREELPIGVEG